TYFEWMRNIEPWCVSRQLWWGHRIPAWYGPLIENAAPGVARTVALQEYHVFVAENATEALAEAKKYYGRDAVIVSDKGAFEDYLLSGPFPATIPVFQDEDVLDTWFSSGLWPFSTMGWPQETQDLKRFYPTSTLVTAFDIIFFWVARMMMLGLHVMKEVPFRTIYIHALVRDASGAKMSKSKGNVADPLSLIDKYGADALRFTLAAMAAQGRDIKLNENRIEGYRNFGTKIWNAARFCQMNECALWANFDPASPKETVNRWIVSETARAQAEVTRELEAFRFNEAAGALYRFVWNVFCDWYLELIKPLLAGEDEAAKEETRRTAAWALDQALKLSHPFMPFITEELWARLAEFGAKRDRLLIEESWPTLPESLKDEAAEEEIDWIVRLITETRSTRAELNVPPGARIPLLLIGARAEDAVRLERYQDLIDRLARLEYSTTADEPPAGAVTFVLDGATIALPLEGVVDFKAEAERLKKDIAKLEGEIAKQDGKLNNPDFLRKAPEEVVEEIRERRADAEASKAKLAAALERIAAAA
ncbi:MAG: class I tRNA ligase family protein, partial [Hyphomonadaceae bacterium]